MNTRPNSPLTHSKVRLARGGDRLDVVVEELRVVLGANLLVQRAAVGAAILLPRVPRHGEGARVLDMDVDRDRFSAFGEAEALDHVQLLGVRRAERIDIGLVVEPDGVNHQRVAVLVMAAG